MAPIGGAAIAAAALAAAAGFLGWAIFSLGDPVREAWDIAGWWGTALPVQAIFVAILGFLVPVRVWRWSLALVAGQLVAMLAIRPAGSDLGLLPLGVVFVLMPLALAFTALALVGGMVARRGWNPALL
jgi:hypothetical protein